MMYQIAQNSLADKVEILPVSISGFAVLNLFLAPHQHLLIELKLHLRSAKYYQLYTYFSYYCYINQSSFPLAFKDEILVPLFFDPGINKLSPSFVANNVIKILKKINIELVKANIIPKVSPSESEPYTSSQSFFLQH